MQGLQFVGTDQTQLTLEQYQRIQDAVVTAVRKPLVGRLIMPTEDLGDFGIQQIKYYEQTDMSKAAVGMAMVQQNADIVGLTPKTLDIPVIWKDFVVYARDLASSKRFGIPLDTSAAVSAGKAVAEREEELIWQGVEGFSGFLNVAGTQTQASAGAWTTPGNGYTDIINAIAKVEGAGYAGRPVAIVTSKQMADLRLLFGNTGIPQLEKVQELADVYKCYFLPDDTKAIVTVPDPENYQLQLAQNTVIHSAALPTGDWFFRVYEALRPQFKRANSICMITGITA